MSSESSLILASASPRRKELLQRIGVQFEVHAAGIDETLYTEASPERLVTLLAEEKARVVAKDFPERFILAADTIVALVKGAETEEPDAYSILNKPSSAFDAEQMLHQLSGRDHYVWTGFTLCCQNQKVWVTNSCVTTVTFANLNSKEIRAYVDTKEPLDKAGAYAIQGYGSAFVRKIKGSYTNVVGLPLTEVLTELKRFRLWNPENLKQGH